MIRWIVWLVLLAVIQTRIFKLSKQEFWKSTLHYGAVTFLVICEAEWIRNFSEEFAFEWWAKLLVMFAGFLTAKIIFYTKNTTAKISPFVFSAVLTGLAWLTFGDSLNEWTLFLSAAGIAVAGTVISFLFMSMGEKVELSDVSKFFDETPVFLIVAAFFIIILSYCLR